MVLPVPAAAFQELVDDGHDALRSVLRQVGTDDGFGRKYIEAIFDAASSSRPQQVKISVCGSSGAGKSALTNALRDVPHDHRNAAPTNVVECTLTPAVYPHPEQPTIVFQDNPGYDYIVKHFRSFANKHHAFDNPCADWFPTCARCEGTRVSFTSFKQCKCGLSVHTQMCIAEEDRGFRASLVDEPCPTACASAEVKVKRAIIDQIESADFVLVVTSERLKEGTDRYIEVCKELGKPFCLVRTKVDIDIQNHQHTSCADTVQVICDRIRESLEASLKASVGADAINDPVFLVNSLGWYTERLEISDLQAYILKSLPRAQMQQFLRIVKTETAELIERKRKEFHASGFGWKASAALGSFSPIPGSGIVVDYIILDCFGLALKKAFSLDQQSMGLAITSLRSRGIDSSEVEFVYSLATHTTIWGKCVGLNAISIGGACLAGPWGYAAGCAIDGVAGYFIIEDHLSAMVDEAATQAHRIQRAIAASIKGVKLGFHIRSVGEENLKWWSLQAGEVEGLVFANREDADDDIPRLVVRGVRSPVEDCVRLRAHVAVGTDSEGWYLSCCNKILRLRPPGEIPNFGTLDADFRLKHHFSGKGSLAFESASHPGWFVAGGSQHEPLELHQVSSFEADGSQATPPEVQHILWIIGDVDE